MIWRWFWREWRSPSLLIVWLALTLAVACVLALGTISDRMEKGLSQQSRDFLAGDRVLKTSHPAPEEWLLAAKQQGLSVSRQLSFMTMTFAGDRPQLADVKATDLAYPLYGKLETSPTQVKLEPGTALVAPRLLALLGVKVGDTLEVGDTSLKIIGEVLQEPDSGFNPFQTAPRILINLADVEKTGAIQPGSRLSYHYMFAGPTEAITQFSDWLTPQLKPDQRWYGLQESGGALGKSLQRAQQFLLLSALLTLLLSIAAVAVAMGHYCRSRYDLVAVLKTLGAGRSALRRLIIGQWLSVLVLAGLCGSVIGLLFEKILVRLLSPVLPAALPAAGVWPWIWSMGSLILISLLVGIRPYRQLLATQPLRVLRRDVTANIWPLRYFIPVMIVIVVGLLALLMGGNSLLWAILGGMVVLALLLVLRGDLLDRWQQQLPPDSPNYFLLNMTPQQVPQVTEFLTQHQITPSTFYPIVRVRLSEINEQLATERVAEDAPGGEAVNRELNLTWQQDLPAHNILTAGQWPPKADEVSIEQGIADRLGIKIGDKLTFSGDTQSFGATVSSVRQVDWESLRPNFYFIFPPGALDGQPQTWLTSFRYHGDGEILTQLNRQFPTLSLLDIGAMLKQVGQVLQQVSRALEVMVVLVIICGTLLLLAQVQVGMRQRRQELVVYRTLGASKRLLRGTLWWEFALLGLVAGLAAAIGAEAALWALQRLVFDFPWQPNWVMWWLLPLAAALLLSLCGGWLGARLLRGRALFRSY
ncbi:TPA: ABC transporter permease [Yersinia enterocolitica]